MLCNHCRGELKMGSSLIGPPGALFDVDWSVCQKCGRIVVEGGQDEDGNDTEAVIYPAEDEDEEE